MGDIACQYCGHKEPTFMDAQAHQNKCPRLRKLGLDLEMDVKAGKIDIEQAEAIQAKRPKLRL